MLVRYAVGDDMRNGGALRRSVTVVRYAVGNDVRYGALQCVTAVRYADALRWCVTIVRYAVGGALRRCVTLLMTTCVTVRYSANSLHRVCRQR